MTINEKISSLRSLMNLNNLKAWIVNGTDSHNSEYVCPHWRTREWITGFTGSAGFVVVTENDAILWVDSRYYYQAEEQIKDTCVRMLKIDGPEAVNPYTYLASLFSSNEKIGIAGETLTINEARILKEQDLNVLPMDDLIDKIWTDRPAIPSTSVEQLPLSICGEDVNSKFIRLREVLKEKKCKWTVISSLDDIAWLLNLRADDIKNSPFFVSFFLLNDNEAFLFTNPIRFNKNNIIPEEYKVIPYSDIETYIAKIPAEDKVLLNPNKTNMMIYKAFKSGVEFVEEMEPTTNFKAAKNEIELEGMKKAHFSDGIAMVNFLAKVKNSKESFSEYSIAKLLDSEREKRPDFVDFSFGTIAGWAYHGAMCHYCATKETSIPIEGNGLLVLDSGGHYQTGTTDITRTLLFGKASEEQKRDYTLVLKGHLALKKQAFPAGTSGYQLDALARQFLWQEGLTFYHGTGHGVGFRLSVHEGPASFSYRPSATAPIVPGMVISDEPGIYKEGRHGIRIENLLYVKEFKETEFGKFYNMDFLTLCPYERDLIDLNLLNDDEIKMIDSYHETVYEKLSKFVDNDAKDYLRKATMPLNGDNNG